MAKAEVLSLKEKLHSIYSLIDHIAKEGDNTQQHYKYIKSVDVIRNVRQALIDQRVYAEVSFNFLGEPYTIARSKDPNAPFTAVNVICNITFNDLDSNETRYASGVGSGCDTSDKAAYKAQTGALKYALKNAFLIPDEAGATMDPEADSSVDEPAEPVRRAAPKASVPKAEIPGTHVPAGTKGADPILVDPPQAARGATAAAGSPVNVGTDAAPADVEPTKTTQLPTRRKMADAPSEDDALPTEEELVDFRARFSAFGESMKKKATEGGGGLKMSKNLPVNRKLLAFLLHVTQAAEPQNITVAQWHDFFARVDAKRAEENGLVQLATLINQVNGVEEQK